MGMAATAPLLASLRLTVAAAGRTTFPRARKTAVTAGPAAALAAVPQVREQSAREMTAVPVLIIVMGLAAAGALMGLAGTLLILTGAMGGSTRPTQ